MRQAREEWKAHRQPRMPTYPSIGLPRRDRHDDEDDPPARPGHRGTRLKADAPFGHWTTQTFIAGLRCDGLTAPWVIDHPMNRETFDTYVDTSCSNLAQRRHRNSRQPRQPQERKSRGHPQATRRLVSLPAALQSDLNPIEMAFAKLKAHLRRIGARTIDALWKALGDICALYSEQECWNFFQHSGYASD